MKYAESFRVFGRTIGIQDQFDPELGEPSPREPTHRYKLWVSGSAFGDADTLEQARSLVHTYVVQYVNDVKATAEETVKQSDFYLKKLGTDSSGLLDWKEKQK